MLTKSNPNHDPKTGRFVSSGRTPLVRAEKRGLRALYHFTRHNPLAAPDSMLVRLTAQDLRVAMAKGPAMQDENGNLIVRGRRLNHVAGSGRGWGMVKVLWKHGEKSGKERGERVTLADVLALPEVVRSQPSDASADGTKLEWRRVRHDGRTVVYAASQFAGDDHKHVVSIHIAREAEMRKSTPSPPKNGYGYKRDTGMGNYNFGPNGRGAGG